MLPQLTTLTYLAWQDWTVFFLILALTAGVAVYGNIRLKKGGNKALDYLLMGRRRTPPRGLPSPRPTSYGGMSGVK